MDGQCGEPDHRGAAEHAGTNAGFHQREGMERSWLAVVAPPEGCVYPVKSCVRCFSLIVVVTHASDLKSMAARTAFACACAIYSDVVR